jgi:TPR repeat protein
MQKTLVFTSVLFTVMHPNASAWLGGHSVKDAKALLSAGRYLEALPILRKSAAHGNAEGELYLGIMYQRGWGVAQDYAQAL